MYEAFCSGNVLSSCKPHTYFGSKLYRHLQLPVLFFPLPVSVCAWRGRGGDVTCLSVCDMSTSTLPPFILACTLCGVNVSARCVYRQSTHIHTCSFYGRSTFAL